ncbi:hypothetical protein EQG49_13365 [Periweissella cryptocerci]|uniref:DNA topoisomerase n=1 Tax=Periweissella cryptocerci TaxID=2506420 RepID=A0A4P6YX47_9LACO|nr:DNA topoisomerase [Periweissella cryptocerci]QBO37386.1 hypothetical protein EQG49_13365 [Periweissella cryptocerci]
MSTVILAEKPDQAQNIALGLFGKITKVGINVYSGFSDILNDDVKIVHAQGHLFGLKSPEEYFSNLDSNHWRLSDLPFFLPDNPSFQYSGFTSKQKDWSKKLYESIAKEVRAASNIIIATDPDREGEHIAYLVLNRIGIMKNNKPTKPLKRAWFNDMTAREFQRAFANLRDWKETYNFHIEALARQIADWEFGYNLTRAVTLGLRNQEHYAPKNTGGFSIGRVQTPILQLIGMREKQIQEYKPIKHWSISAIDKSANIQFNNSVQYDSFDEATKVCSGLDETAKVVSVETIKKTKAAPKLLSMVEVEQLAGERWGYAPIEVDDLIEKLYLKKLMSYPRGSSRYITDEVFAYLLEHLDDYKKMVGLEFDAVNTTPRKEYVDNSKVSAHYALVPSVNVIDLSKLPDDEANILRLVTEATLMMFAPDWEYEETTVILDNGVELKATGKVTIAQGWREFDKTSVVDVEMPNYSVSSYINVSTKLVEGVNTKPKRLTQATLVKGLKKLKLGTEATRSEIINQLLNKKQYLKLQKKELFLTDKATIVLEFIHGSIDVPTTTMWEEQLCLIGEGKASLDSFIKIVRDDIKEKVAEFAA